MEAPSPAGGSTGRRRRSASLCVTRPSRACRAWREDATCCAGHSLGGALAIVFAAALREARPALARRIAGVVSFGAPRVGDAEFAARFNSAFSGRAFRVTHGADIIPHVRGPGARAGCAATRAAGMLNGGAVLLASPCTLTAADARLILSAVWTAVERAGGKPACTLLRAGPGRTAPRPA